MTLDLAVEKRASTGLTALPLDEYGLHCIKSAFQNVLALHYGWLILHAPTHFACGISFSVEQALFSLKVGYHLFNKMK